MKSVWQALIWKEWHEHKWKLAALTAIFIAMPATTLLSDEPEGIFTAVTAVLWLAVPILSVFIGASAAARENSERTMPFLQSLPATMWRPALVKLVFSILTVCISIAGVVAFTYVAAQIGNQLDSSFDRGIRFDRIFVSLRDTNWYWARLLFGWGSGISLVIWVAVAGVNRSDEVRAGALGILAIVGYWFLMFVLAWSLDLPSPNSGFPAAFMTLAAIGPGGPVAALWLANPDATIFATPPIHWSIIVSSIVFHAGLAIWFVARFGCAPRALRPSERTASVVAGEWLAPPRRTRFGALMWKQCRESGPLALVAMCMIFLIAISYLAAGLFETYVVRNWRDRLLKDGFQLMAIVWMFLGFFVAIVAGVGAYFEDLRPGMDTFWRSRPIHRDLWFWTKFSFGLVITLFALLIPVLVGLAILAGRDMDAFEPDPDFYSGLFALALQATVFASAALAMILLRQPIYAAVIAIAPVTLLPLVVEYFHWNPSSAAVGVYFGVTFILSTFLAWLAVRYDWSLRR